MAFLAFRRAERHLAVMTAAAEFALIYIVHLHAGAAFFELKDSGVAAIAFQHSCMELVAEDCRGLSGRRIREFLLKRGHLMALCTVCRGEGPLAVVTASTGTALIHKVHGYPGGALFHVEDLRMTFAAGIFLRMVLVCEGNRHSGACEGEVSQLMATVTDILVQVRFLMGFYYMALVAVNSEASMFFM
jgi:hypothetical protein